MHQYVVADVFTSTPLEGNPVAVFTDAAGIPAERMQRIARELNLSETVFVFPASGSGDVRVRIFTPVNELPFAGHPTMGAAIVLGATRPGNTLVLETGVGEVPFEFERDGQVIASARMRQPIPTWTPYEHAELLLSGIGVTTSIPPVTAYHNGPRHVYVGLDSIAELSTVEPGLRVLARLPDMAAICFAGEGRHWRIRMFSPAYGVAEDAATGSAAGPLAVHLGRHGLCPFGTQIEIHQGVEMGRPSVMYATAWADGDTVQAVEVAGSAVIVARGELYA